mgnify:FL=1
MSIVFVPKIPYGFREVVAKPKVTDAQREYNSWSTKELRQLVELRAIGVSYKKCGELLHRGKGGCAVVMCKYGHSKLARARQEVLIQAIMDEVE